MSAPLTALIVTPDSNESSTVTACESVLSRSRLMPLPVPALMLISSSEMVRFPRTLVRLMSIAVPLKALTLIDSIARRASVIPDKSMEIPVAGGVYRDIFDHQCVVRAEIAVCDGQSAGCINE